MEWKLPRNELHRDTMECGINTEGLILESDSPPQPILVFPSSHFPS